MKIRYMVGALVILTLASGCIVNTVEAEQRRMEKYFARPVISKGMLDTIDFKQKWEFHLDKEVLNVWLIPGEGGSASSKDTGVLLAFAKDYVLYRINPVNGVPIWAYRVGAKITQVPFVYRYPPELGLKNPEDELILVLGDIVQIVDVEAGDLLFQIFADFPVASAAWASRTHVYLGSWNERVYAYRKDDMKNNSSKPPQWQYRTWGDILARGEVFDPCMIIVSEDGKIYNLNAAKGTKNWTVQADDAIIAPPYLYRKRLYVGSLDTWCYSLDAQDGRLYWRFGCQAPIDKTPMAIKGTVYCTATNDYLFAIHRGTGKELWKVRGGRKVLCRGREKVYILNDNKEVSSVENETGQLIWKEPFFEDVDFFVTNPNAELPVIFLGYKNGWFFALEEKEKY